MTDRMTRFSLWVGGVLCVGVCLIGLQASRSAAQDQAAGMAQSKPAREALSVTGCLSKGVEPGGFYLTAEDGKMWELSTRTVKLQDHAGHKVTLTGYQIHRPKAIEDRMANSEQKEAAGKPYADMHVTELKMISESCQ